MTFNKFPKDPEKRYYQRVRLELPVEIKLADRAISAKTDNISCGGLFLSNLQMPVQPSQGESFQVSVQLPEHNQAVRLNATIARVETGGSSRQGVALEFSGLYDDSRLEIDRFVKKHLMM